MTLKKTHWVIAVSGNKFSAYQFLQMFQLKNLKRQEFSSEGLSTSREGPPGGKKKEVFQPQLQISPTSYTNFSLGCLLKLKTALSIYLEVIRIEKKRERKGKKQQGRVYACVSHLGHSYFTCTETTLTEQKHSLFCPT